METDWIATVDGVKDNIILCTIAKGSRGTSLQGQYVAVPLGQDLILGRMGSINVSNPIHADSAFKPYLMVHGRVAQWSQEVDIEESTIAPMGVVDSKDQRMPQQSWPSTGTLIRLATSEDIERFANEKTPRCILTVGTIPNVVGLPATIINRSFGLYEDGGYGEGRHQAVFGQNGSGKTAFALMLIAGKLAAHPEMGLLMPDTAGDLADGRRHNRGDFRWNYLEVLEAAKVDIELVNINDIRMTSRETLKYLLRPVIRRHCNTDVEKAMTLADYVVEGLFDKDVDPEKLTSDAVLEKLIERIPFAYASGVKEKQIKAITVRDDPVQRRQFDRDFARVYQFFDGREQIGDLVQGVLEYGRKVVIRMDTTYLYDTEQEYVMRELMRQLTRHAQRVFKDHNRMCNALVVLDEGVRWVPEGAREEGEIGFIVERAFRETRKYGVGWMVIAQSMTNIAKTVLRESHMKWFGRGLGIGNDRVHLESSLPKPGVVAYENLQMQGGYFFVGTGHDNNLGTEGDFCTVHPFGGDATTALINANPAIFRRRM